MSETVTEQTAATPAEVRAWAQANGLKVGDRGRVSAAVKDTFTERTGRPTA